MQWCLPFLRQQAGRRASSVLSIANNGETTGRPNATSNKMESNLRNDCIKPSKPRKPPGCPIIAALGRRSATWRHAYGSSAAEMIIAFARENHLARTIGENTAGRLLSATSVKVGHGFRLALPNLVVEAVPQFPIDLTWVVVVEAAKSETIVEQYSPIRNIRRRHRNEDSLPEALSD